MIQPLFYSCFSTLFKGRKTYNVTEEIIIVTVGIFCIVYIMYYDAYVYVVRFKN